MSSTTTAQNGGKIAVTINLDKADFVRGVATVRRTLQTLNKNLGQTTKQSARAERGVKSLGSQLRDFSIIVGQAHNVVRNLWHVTGRWMASIVRNNSQLEQTLELMRGMRREMDPLARQVGAMQDLKFSIEFAKNNPFSINEITNSFVKLKSAGIEPTTGSLQSLTDAVANYGGSDAILHRASIAIQQMAGKGVVSMEELRQQLGEAVPDAMNLMARAAGLSVGELVDKISRGSVESGRALDLLLNEFKLTFGGRAQALMSTMAGKFARMKTQWVEFSGIVGEGGLNEALKDVLDSILKAMDTRSMKRFGLKLGEVLGEAVRKIKDFAVWVYESRRGLMDFGKVVLVLVGVKYLAGLATTIGEVGLALKGMVGTISNFVRASRAAAGVSGVAALTASMGAVTAAAGPIVIAIGAMGAAIYALKLRADRTAKSMRGFYAAVAGGGPADSDDTEVARKRLEKLRSIAADLDGDFLSRGTARSAVINDMGNLFGTITTKEAKEWVADQMATLQAALDQDTTLFARDAGDERAKEIVLGITEKINETRPELATALEGIRKEFELNDALGDPEYMEARKEAIRSYYIGVLEVISEQRGKFSQQAKKFAADTLSGETARRALADLRKMYSDTVGEMNKSLDLANHKLKLLEKDKKSSAGDNRVEKLNSRIAGLKATIESLNSDGTISQVNVELAKFNEELRQNPEDENLRERAEQIRERIRLEVELREELKKRKAELAAIANVDKKATELEAKVLADLKSELAASSGDVYTKMSAGMVAINREFETLAVTLPPGSEALRELEERFKGIRDVQNEIDFVRFSRQITDITQNLKIGAMNTTDGANARFARDEQQMREQLRRQLAIYGEGTNERRQAEEQFLEWRTAAWDEHLIQTSPTRQLLQQWGDFTANMKDLWRDTMQSFSDRFTEFVETGKFNWKGFVTDFISGLLKIIQQKAFQQIMEGFMNGGNGGEAGFWAGIVKAFAGGTASANGNIVDHAGARPLRAYAKGGIAKSPQISLFGEGDTPEAYVPLPDGRSIPVTMAGGLPAPNVSVNVINQSGKQVEAEQGGQSFDGKSFVLDVVLTAASQPGRFRDGLKGAVSR